MKEKILNFDKNLFLKINQWSHPKSLVWFFIFIDLLSYSGILATLFCLVLIFGISGVFGDIYSVFGKLGLAVIWGTTFLNEVVLKHLFFHRKRPHEILPNVKLYWLKPVTGSFPSGQTTSVFSWVVFFGLLFLAIGNSWVLVVGLIFGFLTAFERVYLGAHFPLDVLGSIMIGSLIGVVFLIVFIYFVFNSGGSGNMA